MSTEATRIPAGERRTATIESIVAPAAQCKPGEITTTAIAERMNLTRGALFRHFLAKDATWEAVVIGWVSERLLSRTDRAANAAASPLAGLEAVFMTHIDFAASHPGVPLMMFGELQRTQRSPAKRVAQESMRRYGERLRLLIAQGKLRGEISAQVDSHAASALFIGLAQSLVMQALLGGRLEGVRACAPGAFAIYRRGIASAGSEPGSGAAQHDTPRSRKGSPDLGLR